LNRIKQLRNEKNIKQDVLANLLNLEVAGVSKLETGRVPLKDEYIIKLSEYFNVSTDYLLGKSNIRNSENNQELKIPVLGVVKAGYNWLADENVIGYVSVNDKTLKGDGFFAVQVKGISMVPEIYEGDIAIVKKQNDFENGDYVVALINGDEATIKKAYKNDTGLLLRPANNSVEPLIFTKEDIETLPVTIIGVVYNITRSFK
jgi:repressor LexA